MTAVAAGSLSLLLVGAGGALPASAPQAVQPAPVFAISGRGFGHGVGMSQYGALGFAQNGADYASILAHYYPGTELGRVPGVRLRVLLAESRPSVRIASAAPFTIRDADGAGHMIGAGSHVLDVSMRVQTAQGPLALRGPLLLTAGAAPLQLDGRRYRGSLELASVQSRLRVVNLVGLEQYLFGVVPREVPFRWPEEALRAQAVAARSYALATRRSGPFELYADVRSQVYGGMDAEQLPTSLAVQSTAGEVLLHQGRAATTFFFSTSGGRTASVAEAWPGSGAVPYLVSVEDPYDHVSPHHTWGPLPFSAERIRAAVGLRGTLLDVRTTSTPSGRVSRVVGVGARGQVSLPGAAFRTALGLRSTWFEVGVLALDRPRQPATVSGSQLRLTGIARAVPGATLEQRSGGGAWTAVAVVAPAADGAFTTSVRPVGPTQYRLAARGVRTGALPVAVAPLVRLAAPSDPGSLTGTVRPLSLAGAAVVVQRAEGTTWRRVATGRVDATGSYALAVALTPGRYRAVVPAARGFLAGTSPSLDVVAP